MNYTSLHIDIYIHIYIYIPFTPLSVQHWQCKLSRGISLFFVYSTSNRSVSAQQVKQR